MATEFDAPCDACRAELEYGGLWSLALAATTVHGTLCAEADVGFCTCRRGHRIVMRRAVSRPVAVVR